jgi:hypothetical protein
MGSSGDVWRRCCQHRRLQSNPGPNSSNKVRGISHNETGGRRPRHRKPSAKARTCRRQRAIFRLARAGVDTVGPQPTCEKRVPDAKPDAQEPSLQDWPAPVDTTCQWRRPLAGMPALREVQETRGNDPSLSSGRNGRIRGRVAGSRTRLRTAPTATQTRPRGPQGPRRVASRSSATGSSRTYPHGRLPRPGDGGDATRALKLVTRGPDLPPPAAPGRLGAAGHRQAQGQEAGRPGLLRSPSSLRSRKRSRVSGAAIWAPDEENRRSRRLKGRSGRGSRNLSCRPGRDPGVRRSHRCVGDRSSDRRPDLHARRSRDHRALPAGAASEADLHPHRAVRRKPAGARDGHPRDRLRGRRASSAPRAPGPRAPYAPPRAPAVARVRPPLTREPSRPGLSCGDQESAATRMSVVAPSVCSW